MSNVVSYEAGRWSALGDHVFQAGSRKGSGKVFLSERLESTGAEVSLNRLEAGQGYPFLHRHETHEEIYIVVSGTGDFLVDGQQIPLREGSTLRVAPNGARSIRASMGEPLCFLCIQAVDGTLKQRTIADGRLVEGPVEWK
jgi:mannose-6-phosphate isomerase-like protein (cupin superfamily)